VPDRTFVSRIISNHLPASNRYVAIVSYFPGYYNRRRGGRLVTMRFTFFTAAEQHLPQS
jgi:hypothetical protein